MHQVYQKQAQQGEWPKEAQETCPIKVIKLPRGEHSFSLSLPVCLSICTLFAPNKHFTCFTTFLLYMEIHFRTAEGPGPCHRLLVLVVWWPGFDTLTAMA